MGYLPGGGLSDRLAALLVPSSANPAVCQAPDRTPPPPRPKFDFNFVGTRQFP